MRYEINIIIIIIIISEYFTNDHMNSPNPKKLQQQMIFYIIYFFCRRGRENLYDMMQTTYKLVTQPHGLQYVIQEIDEIDKNHGPDDPQRTNEGRMYGNGGKNCLIAIIFSKRHETVEPNEPISNVDLLDHVSAVITVTKIFAKKVTKLQSTVAKNPLVEHMNFFS